VDPEQLVGKYHRHAQWKYYEGILDSKQVGLIISGIGRRRTRQGLKWIRRIREPERVVSIGTAGALNPALPLGEIWIASWVASLSNFQTEGKYQLVLPTSTKPGDSGGLMTAASPILREFVRNQIQQNTGASAVDMEGVAVARWAKKHNFPATIVKVITDLADEGAEREYSQQVTNASKILSDYCYDFIVDSDRFWRDS
jgi:adenosylhomocysteine nucleosidase